MKAFKQWAWTPGKNSIIKIDTLDLSYENKISIEPDCSFYLVVQQTLKESIAVVFQSKFTLFLQSNGHLF